MRISREFHYDSAHKLTGVPAGHKCSNLHGHTYRLTITVDGPVRDDGFVIDFADIDRAAKPVIDMLDHTYLNEVDGLDNPTVENQLLWLWEQLTNQLPELAQLHLKEGLNNSGTHPTERNPA